MTVPSVRPKIAVIGAGMMGQGCAQAFASSGYEVALQSLDDPLFRSVLERIRNDLVFLAERGVGKAGDIEPTLERITTTSRLEEALDGADFVLECIFEDPEAKRRLFREMDRISSPEVILATNTSVIRIAEVAGDCARKDRVIGAHWWNPPFLMPLVEVVPATETSPETVGATMDLLVAAGKSPVLLRKDIPGFVGNRLLHALWREAMSIVDQGVADTATVDLILKLGPGLRMPVLAPFEQADMVGLDLTLSVQGYLLKYLESSSEPSAYLREKVAKNELGFKTGGNGFQHRTQEEMTAIRATLLDYLTQRAAVGGTAASTGAVPRTVGAGTTAVSGAAVPGTTAAWAPQ